MHRQCDKRVMCSSRHLWRLGPVSSVQSSLPLSPSYYQIVFITCFSKHPVLPLTGMEFLLSTFTRDFVVFFYSGAAETSVPPWYNVNLTGNCHPTFQNKAMIPSSRVKYVRKEWHCCCRRRELFYRNVGEELPIDAASYPSLFLISILTQCIYEVFRMNWRIYLTHWGRVTQVCVFTLQLCKTDVANLRF